MLVFRWYALLPERDMDWVRHTCGAIFSDYFGTLWREDELSYDIREDHWTTLPREGKVYNPIISATFSFVAVCKVDLDTVKLLARRVESQLHCYTPALYKSFILDGEVLADDVFDDEDADK